MYVQFSLNTYGLYSIKLSACDLCSLYPCLQLIEKCCLTVSKCDVGFKQYSTTISVTVSTIYGYRLWVKLCEETAGWQQKTVKVNENTS